ncbi:hypothetical protein DMJ13_19125 [halophilic archaeon]|nr:hypothetical protein DMJ13_19125 [halophilic archaeon]
MRALFYFRESESPIGAEQVPDQNLPYIGDTVVLQDGSYRVSDVRLRPRDDVTDIAEIEITTNPVTV